MKCVIILMALMLMGCVKSTPAQMKPQNDYCLIYKPVFDSKDDTKATRDQVRWRNAEYECICLNHCPKPI